ncbi:MAG: glycosyl transferase family 2, partial [Flavobacteriaceae bacterium]|nr:glycosyl transferase family 2 [Flavobacteriaceae bacterium]
AAMASGEILYFLHCDSYPPEAFDDEIINAVAEGHPAGCFEMVFDSQHLWLRFLGFWTRFNHVSCRGGDQSQYITSELFHQIGGYNEAYKIYEDYILIRELYARKKFHVIRKKIVTSARKYKQYGVLRVQYCHLLIYFKRFCGADSDAIYQAYIECFKKR